MTTRADALSAVSAGRRAGGREAATAFARLLGLAFVISVVVGLLLTAAAVALPAPIVGSEVPAQVEGGDRPAGALPLDALLALAALVLGGLAWKGRAPVHGRPRGDRPSLELHCRVGRSFPRRGTPQ